MTSVFRRGLLAGAAGTAVLNAVTYTDMAVRGRDASSTPEQSVEALAEAAGITIPGSGKQRANRVTALGALLGAASGVAVGVAAGAVRAVGLRLPAPLESALIGAAAMAATDTPMVLLGLTDPAQWSATDWISDVVPHLAYGAATSATLRAMDDAEHPVSRARAGLIVRSALLGVASGSRSSIGVAVPTLTSAPTVADPDGGAGPIARAVAGLGLIGELVADKLPSAPPRTSASGLAARFATATSGATTLARRESANAVLPVLAGALGAAAGSWGGLAWRRRADLRLPDWQAAMIEDAFALTLATAACRRPAAA